MSALSLKGSTTTSVFLEGLNEAQKAAVKAPINSASLCVAGPGSGKTKVLTHRIGYLLSEEMKQNPGSILAITFTNKAAGEMKERLHSLLGGKLAERCTMTTFHSFCALLLRYYGGNGLLSTITGSKALNTNFTIWDQNDASRTIKKILIEDLDLDEQIKPISVLNTINKVREAQVMIKYMQDDGPSTISLKQEYQAHLSKASYASLHRLANKILPYYLEKLYSSNALDFEDLLLTAYKLLQRPEVLEKVRQRYRHIFVDEYQDTNIPQYEIIRTLSPNEILEKGLTLSDSAGADKVQSQKYDLKSRSLFTVGDRNQAIYSWRGARPSNMISLKEHYPGLHEYSLRQNYRCSSSIADVANKIIGELATTTERKAKRKPEPVIMISTADDEAQADCVADIIQTLQEDNPSSKSEYAVMYRTNAQSRQFEELFVKRGIKYILKGGRKFYDRKEIQDVMCFLRCFANPHDSMSLERAMLLFGENCGRKTCESFFKWITRSTEQVTARAINSNNGLSVDEAIPCPPSPLAHLLRLLEEEESPPAAKSRRIRVDQTAKSMLSTKDIRQAMALDENASFVSEDNDLKPRERSALVKFAILLFEVYQMALTRPLEEVLERILTSFVDDEYLKRISKTDEEFLERDSNVRELIVAASKYSPKNGDKDRNGNEYNSEEADSDVKVEHSQDSDEIVQYFDSKIIGDISPTRVDPEHSKDAAVSYDQLGALPSGALLNFVQEAALMAGEDDPTGASSNDGAVFLMTIHASKGLEFDAVFVTGFEEGTLPLLRLDTPEAIEEERRLSFVACTRARSLLFLMHRRTAKIFTSRGLQYTSCEPSRFLDPVRELPRKTLVRKKWKPIPDD